MATEERLAPFSPFYKFVTVKAIIFFSFWQSCFFQILTAADLFSRDTGNVILNLIISVEMVGVAIAQSKAFTYHDFVEVEAIDSPKRTSFVAKKSKNSGSGVCSAMKNLIFSTKDVIDDAHSAFIAEIDEE